MVIYGEQVLTGFGKKHAAARKPLERFLDLTRDAQWSHFEDLKQMFPTADLGKQTRSVIFNIGGNKYRLIALINFEKQTVFIERILTHEEYNRKDL